MKKMMIVAASASLLAMPGFAAAEECSFNVGGMSRAVMTHTGDAQPAGQFVKTGGYGMSYHAANAQPDIVDTAVSAGNFTTLVKAVQAAGLIDTLKSDGPFTVFAPTDEAFSKLPAGTVEALLADPDKLTQILTYHVVPGKLDARKVTSMSRLATVEGSALPVSSIRIAATDIMTSNGVIHVIDEVLIPQS